MKAQRARRPAGSPSPPTSISPPLGLLQAGDQLEQGRLAAARGPDQAEHAVRRHLEVEPLDRPQLAVGVAEAADRDGRAAALVAGRRSRPAAKSLASGGHIGILAHSALLTKKVRKVDNHPARNSYGPGNHHLRLRHRSDGRHDRHGRRNPDDAAADLALRGQAGDRDRHRHLLRGGDQDRRRLAPPADETVNMGLRSGSRPAACRPRSPASGRSRSCRARSAKRSSTRSSTRCSAAPC